MVAHWLPQILKKVTDYGPKIWMFFIRKDINIDPSNFENNMAEKLFYLQGSLTLIKSWCGSLNVPWLSHDYPIYLLSLRLTNFRFQLSMLPVSCVQNGILIL